jgi:hypothetical protein
VLSVIEQLLVDTYEPPAVASACSWVSSPQSVIGVGESAPACPAHASQPASAATSSAAQDRAGDRMLRDGSGSTRAIAMFRGPPVKPVKRLWSTHQLREPG